MHPLAHASAPSTPVPSPAPGGGRPALNAPRPLAERIRIARAREGWSRPQLAQRVGCSADTIKSYETVGRPVPTNSQFLARTLAVLGLRADGRPVTTVDPDDPPVSQASLAQLLTWATRRAFDLSPEALAAGPRPGVAPEPGEPSFVIRGMPEGAPSAVFSDGA